MVVPTSEMLLRMGAGMIIGAAIGYERERSGHIAGLRAHLLVSLAAATFMLVSTQFVYFQAYAEHDLIAVDTSRIAASVVSGVGFLGAGAILRTGINIQGLTTAASLWLVSALGLAAGGGMYAVAFTATLASLFSLTVMRRIEQGRDFHRQVEITWQDGSLNPHTVGGELRGLGAILTDLDYEHNIQGSETHMTFSVRHPNEQSLDQMLVRLESLPGVRRVKVARTG